MSKTTGAKVLAEMFKGYGITHVFYVPQVISTALVAMEDLDIRRVVAHSEKGAAYMADGYARAKGTPGVCLAQPIGASNLASGLRDAFMAHTPLIAISGGPMPASRYRYAYQEVEDFGQFDSVTKANYNVDTTARLPDMIRQAFRDATTGRPGPVHLRFQGRRSDAPLGEADIEALCEPQFSSVPPFRPSAEAHRVKEGVAALIGAKRPIIVAGGGVVHSKAKKEVVELAELLQIPVATSPNGKGTILENHRLSVGVVGTYSRECANRAVHEADLVFYIGSPAGGMATANWTVPGITGQVMQLDIEANELGRNYPNKVALLGDAKATLEAMIAEAKGKAADHQPWVARVQELVSTWREAFAAKMASDDMPIRPERLCKELEAALPADAILVSDTGHAGMWTTQMIELKQPGQRYIRCAGSLGWGLPGALGVKAAMPERPVICFTGDGGMYYHLPELETALRYGINLVVVINNNGALSQELPQLTINYGGKLRGNANEMWKFRQEFNFAKVAEAMGCAGIRVEKPGEIKEALRKALAMNRPVVVEVLTDVSVMAPTAWMPK
jgi:acetolactate synthase I/II/III large subunit